eukprot:Gb_13513 [translate_table: standard]
MNSCIQYRGLAVQRIDESHDQSIKNISSSFKQWFIQRRLSRDTQLQNDAENINSIISRGGWDTDTETELRNLNITLTEQCVVGVLKLQKDVTLGLRFFYWAGQRSGYKHTSIAYYAFFKTLSRAKLTKVMEEWLDSFRKQTHDSGLGFYCTLIMGYSLAEKPELALQMLAQMRFEGLSLDKFSYNELLSILAKENCFDIVDVIEKQMPQRSYQKRFGYSIMITNLCNQGKLDEAKKMLDEQRKNGFVVNDFVVLTLIRALYKERRIDEVGQLIEELRGGSINSLSKVYKIWITTLVEAVRVDEALEYLQKRVSEGFVPSACRYSALVSSLLGKKRYKEVYDLLTEMREKQVFPDMNTMNATMHFFCKVGRPEMATSVFEKMLENGCTPNASSHISLMHGYLKGKLELALMFFEEMTRKGLIPSLGCYEKLIHALCKAGKLNMAVKLFGDIKMNVTIPVPSFTMCSWVIALSYVKLTRLARIHHGSPGRIDGTMLYTVDIFIYNTLLRGLCKEGRMELACDLFSRMPKKGCRPNASTYDILIHGLCKAGRRNDAQKWVK